MRCKPQPRTKLFDTVRNILGRSFRQSEVEAIDRAVEDLAQDSVPCVPSSFDAVRTIGAEGVTLIKQFEGCGKRLTNGTFAAYPDPGTGADPWTIGWGATGKGIGPGIVWTQQQCDARLAADLRRYAGEVTQALGDAPTSQSQFDAMVSFHYNTGAIGKATLTRKHVAQDYAAAAREFDRWVYAGGRVMRGLVRRRTAEAALYRKG